MVIAVDTRGSDAYQEFISNTFKLISSQHPDHIFLFIIDKHFKPPIAQNVIVENNKQPSLLSAIGLSNKTASVLKKYDSSVLVTSKPFKTKVPLCFFVEEKMNLKYVKLSKVIIAASTIQKKEIVEKYKITESKIEVIYKPVNEAYHSINFDEREKIKETFAGGNEFFIAKITDGVSKPQSADLLMLLKAFSKFKKMQKSNMHLLIVSSEIIDEEFKEALRLYKFNTEVTLLEKELEAELSTIMASSYAAVYPFNSNDYTILLQLMQSEVPIISADFALIKEICGNAAVYCDNTDVSIADKMMLIYKDESLRNELIENGSSQIKNFVSQASANALWSSIEKAML